MSLVDQTTAELQALLANNEITVKELIEATYARIEAAEEDVHAFISLNKEEALRRAEELDQVPAEERGPLFGLPLGVKDNIVTKGIATTAASRMLEDFVPVFDATVVERLEAAGMVSVGKLNLDEFAMGATTETSAFKTTLNPWNTAHVPGGSSGGSAAAVAAGEIPFALGTDTGGSIRQPAAYCGIVGMKPTYGRVSRLGAISLASSLDQVGPMTRTVKDNALLLQTMAGVDERDSSSSHKEVPNYVEALTGDIKGLKIGVPAEYFGEGVSEEVKTATKAALETLTSLGAIVEEVSLPHSEYALPAYYFITSAEASSNLARYDGVHYGYRSENATNLDEIYKKSRAEAFGPEVKRRILLGTYTLGAENYESVYKKAQRARMLVAQDFAKAFEQYDVLIGPAAPTTAPALGAKDADIVTKYMSDILTVPINLAGLPSMSIPCGFADGLPIGLQIIGNHFNEETIYQVGYAFEQATDFHKETAVKEEN